MSLYTDNGTVIFEKMFYHISAELELFFILLPPCRYLVKSYFINTFLLFIIMSTDKIRFELHGLLCGRMINLVEANAIRTVV